ncbi:MAG: hypothetical protein ACI9EF_000123 [Pseudohongiellaceae bacterium]|jgi:hypothetical protein
MIRGLEIGPKPVGVDGNAALEVSGCDGRRRRGHRCRCHRHPRRRDLHDRRWSVARGRVGQAHCGGGSGSYRGLDDGLRDQRAGVERCQGCLRARVSVLRSLPDGGTLPPSGQLDFDFITPSVSATLFEGVTLVKEGIVADSDGVRFAGPSMFVTLGTTP